MYQLECDNQSIQPYLLHVQNPIDSFEIRTNRTTIQTNEQIYFSIEIDPTEDLTILFKCNSLDQNSTQILFIQQIINPSEISVGNCNYSRSGEYSPSIDLFNHLNHLSKSIQINVEQSLIPFEIHVENSSDISQLIPVTIKLSENVPFEGFFNLTIVNSNINMKNSTRIEYIRFSSLNNYQEKLFLNIDKYGEYTLLVTGGLSPIIHQTEAKFTIGIDLNLIPQVYIVNSIGYVNEEIIWIDFQWNDGIGFNILVQFDLENQFQFLYHQLTEKNILNGLFFKRIDQKHIQIGFK